MYLLTQLYPWTLWLVLRHQASILQIIVRFKSTKCFKIENENGNDDFNFSSGLLLLRHKQLLEKKTTLCPCVVWTVYV